MRVRHTAKDVQGRGRRLGPARGSRSLRRVRARRTRRITFSNRPHQRIRLDAVAALPTCLVSASVSDAVANHGESGVGQWQRQQSSKGSSDRGSSGPPAAARCGSGLPLKPRARRPGLCRPAVCRCRSPTGGSGNPPPPRQSAVHGMGRGANQIRCRPAIANRDGPSRLYRWTSAGPRRPPGPHLIAPLDPLQQVAQLRGADRYRATRRRRPRKPATLQTLRIERYPQAVVPENFDQVTFASSKDKEITCVRIASEVLLNLQSQRVHAPTHVRNPGRKPHPHTARNRWGGRPLPTASIRAKVTVS